LGCGACGVSLRSAAAVAQAFLPVWAVPTRQTVRTTRAIRGVASVVMAVRWGRKMRNTNRHESARIRHECNAVGTAKNAKIAKQQTVTHSKSQLCFLPLRSWRPWRFIIIIFFSVFVQICVNSCPFVFRFRLPRRRYGSSTPRARSGSLIVSTSVCPSQKTTFI
jgi:hypothetical protein